MRWVMGAHVYFAPSGLSFPYHPLIISHKYIFGLLSDKLHRGTFAIWRYNRQQIQPWWQQMDIDSFQGCFRSCLLPNSASDI